ncbi:MAG: putative membrane protein [Saprospiraceae bacterium]|jgi:putative membrane protein
MKNTTKPSLSLVLKGMAMGIAEVIPGVSGGTIAFITGIYETLLNSIKAFGPGLLPIFKKDGVKGVWEGINGMFLVNLLFGMAVGLVGGVFVITKLLKMYPELLWAFFFGLIVASAIYIGRQISKWSPVEIILMIAGTVVAYFITIATPSNGNPALWFVFLCGAIAISALILPGISGSFILLLLGMYSFVIPTVKTALSTFETESLIIVAVFALGCITGLVTFSRFLSWTFKNYHNPTLAILTGFMVGSLNKLWPWRNTLSWIEKKTGAIVQVNPNDNELYKILQETSVLPSSYDGEPQILTVVICMIFGFASVFLLEKLGGEKVDGVAQIPLGKE